MKLTKLWDIATNLAYVAAGITTVILTGDSGPMAWLFLFSMLALTVGSGIFHAKIFEYPLGNHLDVGAMYFNSLLLGALAISPYLLQNTYGTMLCLAVLAIAPLFIWFFRFYLNHTKMEYKISGIFLVILLLAGFRQVVLNSAVNWMYIGMALGFIATAALFRLILNDDEYKWSHGVWHLLSAPGLAYFYAGLRILPV